MTAFTRTELACNHRGCRARFSADEKRVDLTRFHAAKEGWVHGHELSTNRGPARSLDFCMEHAAELGDAKPKALPEHARSA